MTDLLLILLVADSVVLVRGEGGRVGRLERVFILSSEVVVANLRLPLFFVDSHGSYNILLVILLIGKTLQTS